MDTLYLIILNQEKNVPWLVELCNNNQGFISAVLAVVSIFLSFLAIKISISTSKGQVQAQILERRIAVYSKLKVVYNICNRLVANASVELPHHMKLRRYVDDLFLYNTVEYHTAYKLTYLKPILDASDLNRDEDTKLVEEWSDKFFEITKYEIAIKQELEELKTQVHLLYSEEIEKYILEFLEKYQEFRWDIYDTDEEQLKRRIENLQVSLDKLDSNKVFDKMDKETTSNLFKRKSV